MHYMYKHKKKVLATSLAMTLSSVAYLVIPPANLTIFTCTDSDGGKNTHITGYTTLANRLTKRKTVVRDSCFSDRVVTEGYCRTRSSSAQVKMTCPTGSQCSKGVCVALAAAPTPAYTLSLTRSATSPVTTLPLTNTTALLASFTLHPAGSATELRTLKLGFVTNNAKLLAGPFFIKINGATVYTASSTLIANSATDLTSLSLTTFPALPDNQDSTITVEAAAGSSASAGNAITVFFNVSEVRQVATNVIADPHLAIVSGNQLTVQGPGLVVNSLSDGGSIHVPEQTHSVTLATFTLNAGAVASSEDIGISSLTVSQVGNPADIDNFFLYDDNDTPLANVGAGGKRFTFLLPAYFSVPRAGSRTLTLKGDLHTAATGTRSFIIAEPSDVVAVSKTSNRTFTPAIDNRTGRPITIISGAFLGITPANDPLTPIVDQILPIGQRSVQLFKINLQPSNAPIALRLVKIHALGTIKPGDMTNFRLIIGNTTTAQASTSQLNNDNTFTWSSSDNLMSFYMQPGTITPLTIMADISGLGYGVLGHSFRLEIADLSAVNANNGDIVPAASLGATLPVAMPGTTFITPFPVQMTGNFLAPGSSQAQNVVVGTSVGRFRVYNTGFAPITVSQLHLVDHGFHTGALPTYQLVASGQQNAPDYLATTVLAEQSGLNFVLPGAGVRIDSGSFRNFTVSLKNLGGAVSGDSWQLSADTLGTSQYQISETDLHYDGNANGKLDELITALPIDGTPALGTLVKQ